MTLKVVLKATAAAALGLVLASCGGGGGGSSSNLEVTGTAATGAALAGASVEVKCQEGTGSATTSSAGAYTVTMEGGALPCIVRVTGTSAGGAEVTLHSVVETGSSAGSGTSAVANVTPVTEMIVAQLLEKIPADAFAAFDPAAVTQSALATATTAIVEALKTAGIDLGTIDPLKGSLVPPGGSADQSEYDKLLDKLGETVPPEALPQLVTQIATAAAADASSGLTEAMTGVSGGTLAGCKVALSGKYRSMDYLGGNITWDIDFKNGKFARTNGSANFSITTDAANTPCVFLAKGVTSDNRTVEWNVVIGAGGIGTYRAQTVLPSVSNGVTGWLFPVQEHKTDVLAGDWRFLDSGSWRDSSTDPYLWEHSVGNSTIGSDLKMSFCHYDSGFTACEPDTEANVSLVGRSDGGFDLKDPATGDVGVMYGYRNPAGALTLFATTNPSGDVEANERVMLVLTKPTPVVMPAVDFMSKYAESTTTIPRSTGAYRTDPLVLDSTKVTSVDSTAGTYTRVRASDGRRDVWAINKPLEGMRYRDTINDAPVAPVYLFFVSGAAVAFNAPGASNHFYNISVNRP